MILTTKRKEALKDNCGVFGIFAPSEDVARIAYFALHSLQHRGQEGAGITASDGKVLRSIKRQGLVTSVFDEVTLRTLKGFIAIGHNRYSTTGGNTVENVQPIIISKQGQTLAIAHNGNLINSDKLALKLKGVNRLSSSDTEILAYSVFYDEGKSWPQKILNSMVKFKGAYSIIGCTKKEMFAFRDPWGFRPLSIGKLNGYYVLASETCAFDTIGAEYLRDVEPGEVVFIDETGLQSKGKIKLKNRSFCLFEYVYLARPDSIINGTLVHKARQKSGELLASQRPTKADLVVAIPDSGTSAALGYSRASGIPFGEILIKNRYIGRTFISPDQHLREQGVKIKFNPMKQFVRGKKIIVVDDSIVRGTTMKQIVEVLRDAGALELHLRICSPPIRWPCFFGVDTPERRSLVASDKTVNEIKKFIACDSLEYLSLASLIKASGQPKDQLCTACFSGKYPMPVDLNFKKNILEKAC
ncbi:amidophosphoribosyltransferase [Candidatus Gottesmanbacteria bacterium]|nr:amidophosphoribosyltransferase [Candidatus Gottesmanbacteria bacterium]